MIEPTTTFMSRLKPRLNAALVGAAVGAGVISLVGFSWGGWMTDSKAQQLAADRAKVEVLAALVPICVEQSKRDPLFSEKLDGLKSAQIFERNDLAMKTGWATMPGSAESIPEVATACATKLIPAA